MLDGNFRTTEMSLAIALQLWGFTPVLERKTGKKLITFCFNPADAGGTDELGDLVSLFERGELLVEPKAFMRVQKKTREQLYSLLGVREGREIKLRT